MKYLLIFFFVFNIISTSAQEIEMSFELVNKSDHKVDLLFDSRASNGIMFRAELFKDWQVFKKDNSLILHFPTREIFAHQIHLFKDTVIVKKNIEFNVLSDTLKTINFRTNTKYLKNDSGDMDVIEIFDKTEYTFQNSKAYVIQKGSRCTDSGINSVHLKYKKGTVKFLYLNNIKLFETDLNKDGINEIYIINFSCCDGKLKIYRII